ncbi:MAG: helix-turn-helix protein [Gammaproteobacteria bacterium]|jgi:helix-turn-helix protein
MDLLEQLAAVYPSFLAFCELRMRLDVDAEKLREQIARLVDLDLVVVTQVREVGLTELGFQRVHGPLTIGPTYTARY